MSENRKRLLMISFRFPPGGGSAPQRTLKAAKYLSKLGWDIDVITASYHAPPLDDGLSSQLPSSVRVNPAFSPDPDSLRARVCGTTDPGFSNAIARAALKIYGSLCYRMRLVDVYEGWLPFAFIKAIRVLRDRDNDVIYVLGIPQSALTLGYLLKKTTGKPVIVDYDDSWTTAPEAGHIGMKCALRRKLEKAVLRAADVVLSSKESTLDEIKKAFPGIDESKFKYLSNGYDPDDFLLQSSGRSGKFRISYAGRISEKFFYSPESFIKALGENIREGKMAKEDIEVCFSGTTSENYKPRLMSLIDEEGLTDIVHFAGFLDHEEAIAIMKGSSVLLFMIESVYGRDVSYKYAGWIPAKIYEYIYSGVPILAIIPPGKEEEIITMTGTGIIARPNDVDSVKSALLFLYQAYKNGTPWSGFNAEEISHYDRKRLIERLSGILTDTVDRDK